MPQRKPSNGRRRSNGEGSIFQEASGRYRIAISVWVAGKRKQVTRTAWKHADAVAILANLRNEHSAKTLSTSTVTFEDFLHQWLDGDVKQTRELNTAANYRIAVEKRIIPALGKVRIKDLSPLHVQKFVTDMIETGVGRHAQRAAFKAGKTACEYAISLNMIPVNPFKRIKCPRVDKAEMNPFTLFQAKALMEHTAGTRWHALYVLAFTTGMRQGELFGLQWDRIDWAKGTLRVDQALNDLTDEDGDRFLKTPKTKSSMRTVRLTSQAINALRAHQTISMKEGFSGNPLVFLTVTGLPIRRHNFSYLVWKPLLAHLGIEHRGMHNTRHTYATLALGNGADPTVVSRQLGHANVATTFNFYSHAIKDHQIMVVNMVEKLFG